jgi:nucleotide-binding universal stress UspA family protein
VYPPQRILVPTDSSRGADRALTDWIDVANATGATLHLLHVVETGILGPDTRAIQNAGELTERANEVATEAASKVDETSLEPVTSVIAHGDLSNVIRDYIDENEIDLTVVGTHGPTVSSRDVTGSVSAKLVRTSPVPVTWSDTPTRMPPNGTPEDGTERRAATPVATG